MDKRLTVHHDDIRFYLVIDPHRKASALSDVILGGQDGLVNVLGVILGVAAVLGAANTMLAAIGARTQEIGISGCRIKSGMTEKALRGQTLIRSLLDVSRRCVNFG